jgi:hypothetical protein
MAGNPFDLLESTLFDVVTATMGYDATWLPSVGGLPVLSGRVLFGSPSQGHKIVLQDVDYLPEKWYMEYKRGVFDGLKEAVDANRDEMVNINGNSFYIRQITTKYDGDTFVALLQPVS